MFWKQIVVPSQERYLVSRNHRFQGIYSTGEHRLFTVPGLALKLERHKLKDVVLQSIWTDYLVQKEPEVVKRHFTTVRTKDTQLALVYADTKLITVLTPLKVALFWRDAGAITVETVDLLDGADTTEEGDPLDISDGIEEWLGASIEEV